MIKHVRNIGAALLLAVSLVVGGCGREEGVYLLTGAGASSQWEGSPEEAGAGSPVYSESVTSGEEEEESLYIHVCGAVVSEGVVCVPGGSRVYEAIEAAGGLCQDADVVRLNLAAELVDGQKLYVPFVGEEPEPAAESDGRININTAGEERLCELPGIGRSRAADIVAYREAHGGFRTGEDIMKVSGIKKSTYEKLRDYIKVE